ncbi:MAG: hypothetical protein ACDS79_04755, partial [Enterobacteriaceae bacterium]
MGSDVQWQLENGYSREVQGDFSSSDYDEPKSPEDKPSEVFTFACNYGIEDEWLFPEIMNEEQLCFLDGMRHDWDRFPELPVSVFLNHDEWETEYLKFISTPPE